MALPSGSARGSYLERVTAVFGAPMLTPRHSGIGLETAILFAKEGANVLMADISAPALEKALAKVRQLVPNAKTVETKASFSYASPRLPAAAAIA